MTLRQTQPLPCVPLNDQNPNFLSAGRLRKFGSSEVTFWTKEAFKAKTGFYPVPLTAKDWSKAIVAFDALTAVSQKGVKL